MREIKFRGKTKQGEWVYGDLVQNTQDKAVLIITAQTKEEVNYKEVNTNTIGQFTGLEDKNGKEIYEGDIVECKVIGTDEIRRALVGIGECGDSDEELCYGVWLLWNKEKGVFYKEYSSYVAVIGNIYDNPELIKE